MAVQCGGEHVGMLAGKTLRRAHMSQLKAKLQSFGGQVVVRAALALIVLMALALASGAPHAWGGG
jgi:hypothetical protein